MRKKKEEREIEIDVKKKRNRKKKRVCALPSCSGLTVLSRPVPILNVFPDPV
jgi:hypothetical protein